MSQCETGREFWGFKVIEEENVTTMGPTNALSHLPDPDTSSDNTNVTLLPDDLFIHIIDMAFVSKIASSSSTNPLSRCDQQSTCWFPSLSPFCFNRLEV